MSAETGLHQIIKNEPTNGEAWYLLTEAYLSENKTKAISDSLNLAPDEANGNTENAFDYMKMYFTKAPDSSRTGKVLQKIS